MFSKSSLEMLVTVARLGSFTAAAEVLNKVPSAISYSVRQVEQEMDVVLFKRLPRKVELTPAGKIFIEEANVLLTHMEEVKVQTRRAALGWQSRLRITLDNVVRLDQLKPMVEEFYNTFQNSELQINMEVFNGSWDAISQGRADIVIGATSSIPVNGDFEVKDMGALEWAFVVSASHPLVHIDFPTESDLSGFPFICLDDTSTQLPKRHMGNYSSQRRLLLPNWYSAIEMIKNNTGVGYLPRHIAHSYLSAGELIEKSVPNQQQDSHCCLVWKRDPSHKLIKWMIDYLGSSEQLNAHWLKS